MTFAVFNRRSEPLFSGQKLRITSGRNQYKSQFTLTTILRAVVRMLFYLALADENCFSPNWLIVYGQRGRQQHRPAGRSPLRSTVHSRRSKAMANALGGKRYFSIWHHRWWNCRIAPFSLQQNNQSPKKWKLGRFFLGWSYVQRYASTLSFLSLDDHLTTTMHAKIDKKKRLPRLVCPLLLWLAHFPPSYATTKQQKKQAQPSQWREERLEFKRRLFTQKHNTDH